MLAGFGWPASTHATLYGPGFAFHPLLAEDNAGGAQFKDKRKRKRKRKRENPFVQFRPVTEQVVDPIDSRPIEVALAEELNDIPAGELGLIAPEQIVDALLAREFGLSLASEPPVLAVPLPAADTEPGEPPDYWEQQALMALMATGIFDDARI